MLQLAKVQAIPQSKSVEGVHVPQEEELLLVESWLALSDELLEPSRPTLLVLLPVPELAAAELPSPSPPLLLTVTMLS